MTPSALLVGLLPVVLFLAGLMLLDSYKLVSRRVILRSIVIGALAAGLAFLTNKLLLEHHLVSATTLRRYIAPMIEESLKALFLVWLIRSDRLGFLVDAGIHGFALGTGFALVENLYYAGALGQTSLALWIVRGVGTAVMHGCTTAIAGIVSKSITDRRRSTAWSGFVPGLAIAIAVHSGFNHLAFNTLLSTAILLAVMPLLLLVTFERSEKATQEWLGTGFDADVELLEVLHGGEIGDTNVGRYLTSLKEHFPEGVVADMLCLVEIHLELAARAKGMLLARQAGLDLPVDPSIRGRLQERAYLEKSIGPTGKLAIMPFLRTTGRDLWQIHMMMKH